MIYDSLLVSLLLTLTRFILPLLRFVLCHNKRKTHDESRGLITSEKTSWRMRKVDAWSTFIAQRLLLLGTWKTDWIRYRSRDKSVDDTTFDRDLHVWLSGPIVWLLLLTVMNVLCKEECLWLFLCVESRWANVFRLRSDKVNRTEFNSENMSQVNSKATWSVHGKRNDGSIAI